MLARVGEWLFRHRTAIPIPLVLALIVIPPASSSMLVLWAGVAVAGAGELLRLLSVRHIGAISRTRTDRLGPLVESGPFRWVRNPLYLGNLAIWIGMTLAARLPWLAVPAALLIGFEYHAIVRWEEQLLTARIGDGYRQYMARVPRWIPRPPAGGSRPPGAPAFSWGETFFSERGTLAALALGLVLLWAKGRA